MKASPDHARKFFLSWIFLGALLCGCTAQQAPTPAGPSPSPSPEIIPTSCFCKGNIASMPLQEAENLSGDEIVRVLAGRWLYGFKVSTDPQQAITDYEIEEVSIEVALTDFVSGSEGGMVSIVFIAIQPVGVPNDWASIVVEPITEVDTWWRVRVPFRIFLEGETLYLQTAFGWGT